MLVVELSVADQGGQRRIGWVKMVRGIGHTRLKRAYYYKYRASIDDRMHEGEVLHSYQNGAAALTQKVLRAVVAQQKAAKHGRAA